MNDKIIRTQINLNYNNELLVKREVLLPKIVIFLIFSIIFYYFIFYVNPELLYKEAYLNNFDNYLYLKNNSFFNDKLNIFFSNHNLLFLTKQQIVDLANAEFTKDAIEFLELELTRLNLTELQIIKYKRILDLKNDNADKYLIDLLLTLSYVPLTLLADFVKNYIILNDPAVLNLQFKNFNILDFINSTAFFYNYAAFLNSLVSTNIFFPDIIINDCILTEIRLDLLKFNNDKDLNLLLTNKKFINYNLDIIYNKKLLINNDLLLLKKN